MQFKIWQKLAIICAVFAVPIVVLTMMLIKQQNIAIQFAQKELAGTEYLRPVVALINDTIQNRTLVSKSLAGDAAATQQLADNRKKIEQDYAALREVEAKHGEELSVPDRRTSHKLAAIDTSIKALIALPKNLTADASNQAHAAFLRQLFELVAHVGDTSNLILDPDIDSYYLMDSVLLKLPSGQDQLADLTAFGENVFSRKTITADEKTDFIVKTGLLKSNIDGLNSDLIGMRVALKNDSTDNQILTPALDSPLNEAVSATNGLLQFTTNQLSAKGLTAPTSSDQFVAAGQKALAANFALWDKTTGMLDLLLKKRIDGFKADQATSLAVALGAVAIALVIYFVVVRSISRQVKEISDVFLQVAMGDYAARAKVTSGDELGAIASSLNAMLENVLSTPQDHVCEEELVGV